MKNKNLKRGIIFGIVLLFLGAGVLPSTTADLAEDVEASIAAGIEYLITQQNMDGSWGSYEQGAGTAFVLIKLQDRAYEQGYDSPFDVTYPYYQNVIDGWEYLFSHTFFVSPLPVQIHGVNSDNPDTNGNGYGICFDDSGWHPTYTNGIAMMALLASGTPNRENELGLDFDLDSTADTYLEICQETVDWMAFGQADFGTWEGGFGYSANNNEASWADNSNSGYAVLGLAAAEEFGCNVPLWVKTELNIWINYIQNDVNGDTYDGGSGYSSPDSWVNELKTGNLLFQMTFIGDTPSVQRFQDALDYIERYWQDMSDDPGWGYGLSQAHYQAMYCLMKGFEYSSVDLIDLDNDDIPEHDWYAEFATVLITQQQAAGNWPYDYWASDLFSTTWALLTLEKIAPPPVEPKLDQEQAKYTNNFAIYSTNAGAQSFIPTMGTLSYVEVFMRKVGNPPGNLIISIRSSLKGADLVSVSIPPVQISTTFGWVKFDFSDISITPGSTYYLVQRTSGGSTMCYYNLEYASGNLYKNGALWTTYNGVSWYNNLGYDLCFKTYGFA